MTIEYQEHHDQFMKRFGTKEYSVNLRPACLEIYNNLGEDGVDEEIRKAAETVSTTRNAKTIAKLAVRISILMYKNTKVRLEMYEEFERWRTELAQAKEVDWSAVSMDDLL